MTPEEVKAIVQSLPAVPRDLTPIEYLAVVSVVALLIVFVCTVLFVVPRWMKLRAESEEKLLVARASRDTKLVDALREDRRADVDRFSADARAQREAAVRALGEIAATHERAVERIHERLDAVTNEVGALRIDIAEHTAELRADVHRQASETRLEVQRQAAAAHLEIVRLGCYEEPKARAAG